MYFLSVYDSAADQMPTSVYIFLSEYHYLWTRKPNKQIYTAITYSRVPFKYEVGVETERGCSPVKLVSVSGKKLLPVIDITS